ncbi:MAG: hypothetical protein KIC56_07840 [Clostridium sp.]|nr:hypothetical protein [Clostridium sp.]
MSDVMPKQEYIKLPNIEDEDLPEIISSSIIESDNDTAKIELNIHNPTGESISNIKLEYLTAEIEEQNFEDGKSKVIINIKNPEIFVSKYNILEFETKSAYGNTYKRQYQKDEKIILVDFYKEVYSIQEWEQINKFPNENYKLMSDLDFSNAIENVLITNNFSGIIDGAGHTIKNITIQTNSGLIKQLNGTLKNLYIQNYNQNIKNNMSNAGVVLNSGNHSEINNVHIQNANIKFKTSTETSVGFLIGSANGTIQNCSVINGKVEIEQELSKLTLGGIAGTSNATIRNSYVRNISFDINKAIIVNGIGGIVGENKGTIQYCYSQGEIVTTKENIGGIAGTNSGIIQNNYSLINIDTKAIYTGGIVGFNSKSGDSGVINNLYIGNLYSTGDIENRISGNIVLGRGNYGYKKQLINGNEQLVEENISLLDDNELFFKNSYEELLFFDNNFDYSQLDNNIFPKLYYQGTDKLLPNQIDMQLEKNLLKIENAEIERIDSNSGRVALIINNPDMLDIKDITINEMEVTIEKNVLENGKTYIELKVKAIKYFDNYKLSKIIYEKDGIENEQKMETKINLQFFKEITKFEDWQSIDSEFAQNYRLLTDIDFSEKLYPNYNVCIGRLEAPECGYTIKNLNITSNKSEGLIKEAKYSIKNVKFENININDSTASNYEGIIINNTAELINLEFKDITINTPNKNYVACIAKNASNNIKNINLENITCNANTTVAGFIASMSEMECSGIIGKNIYITAKGNYSGGIFGSISCSDYGATTLTKNITIEDSEVTGRKYVGGAIGDGRINNVIVNNTKVEGVSNVGGISGSSGVNSIYAYADNVEVYGSGYNIGGLVGYKNSLSYGRLTNSTVEGTEYSTYNVGGVAGGSAQTFKYIEVNNVKVVNKGDYVGGFVGRTDDGNASNIIYNYLQDCYVEGNNYVGGLVGCVQTGNVYYNYSNTEIVALGQYIGGVTGYIKNANTTTTTDNKIEIHHNYVVGSKIKGIGNIGGLIGKTDKELYSDSQFKSNYIEAYIKSEDTESVSLGIGDRQQENQRLIDNYYYKYSSVNGENPNIHNEIFISEDKYLKEQDLKNKDTYTSKLKWSSLYNYGVLLKNKYPTLNISSLPDQEGIDLPKDDEHIIDNNINVNELENEELSEELEQSFEYANKKIETYSTYSLITAKDGSQTTRNTKLYVKDNNLYAIPVVLASTSENAKTVPVAGNLIIDSYNGKEYETVLGSDGRMYDLKEPITYPENFVNEDIESIGNNINRDSHEVEVTYKNGDKVKFNYQTGKIISSSETDTSDRIGLFDYIKVKISEMGDFSSNTADEISNKYEESKELQTKLKKTSVEEAIEKQNVCNVVQEESVGTATESNEANNSYKDNKYISIYNEKTREYEIYNEEELLDTSKEEVVSENEKIEANNLNEYYVKEGETKNTKMGVVWIVISIIGVGIVLFVLKKNLKKRA